MLGRVFSGGVFWGFAPYVSVGFSTQQIPSIRWILNGNINRNIKNDLAPWNSFKCFSSFGKNKKQMSFYHRAEMVKPSIIFMLYVLGRESPFLLFGMMTVLLSGMAFPFLYSTSFEKLLNSKKFPYYTKIEN